MPGPEKKTFETISQQAFAAELSAQQADTAYLQQHKSDGNSFGRNLGLHSDQTIIDMAAQINDRYYSDQGLDLGKEVSPEFAAGMRTTLEEFRTKCLGPLQRIAEKRIAAPYNVNNVSENREDSDAMREAVAGFRGVRERLDQQFLEPESDNNEFILLYSDLVRFMNYQEALTCGTLVKPLKGDKKENGRVIRRNDQFSYKKKLLGRRKAYEDPGLTKEYGSRRLRREIQEYNERADKKNAELRQQHPNTPDQSIPGFLSRVRSIETRYVKENGPLFDHEPCAEDIMQGAVGDCYFVATLSAIAGRCPQAIRDCIVDNDDGTCTVRLFSENKTPMYVTVEKSVPYSRVCYENGTIVSNNIYAEGPLWVKMIEKAFAQSGLHSAFGRHSYAGINGGTGEKAVRYLLGSAADTRLKIDTYKIDHVKRYPNENFLEIARHCSAGSIITCSTKNVRGQGDKEYEVTKGLPNNHQYNLMDCYERNGIKYVKLRNPHAQGIRQYDADGQPIYDPQVKADGVSEITFADFCEHFDDMTIADFDGNNYSRGKNAQGAELAALYGDSIVRCCEIIRSFKNSRQLFRSADRGFNELKGAAVAAEKAFTENPRSTDQMQKTMADLFKAAQAYKAARDAAPDELSADLKDYAANRYFAADMLCEIRKAAAAHQTLDPDKRTPVDYDNIAHDLLFTRAAASRAQRAMIDVISQRTSADRGLPRAESIAVKTAKMLREECYRDLKAACSGDNPKKLDRTEALCKFLFVDKVCKGMPRLNSHQIFALITGDNMENGCNSFRSVAAAMTEGAAPAADFLKGVREGRSLADSSKWLQKNLPELSSRSSHRTQGTAQPQRTAPQRPAPSTPLKS